MLEPADSSPRSPLAADSRLVIETALGPVAIFRVGDAVHAVEDGCLRCGTTLIEGVLEGTTVRCRVCGWCYDLTNGRLAGLPGLRLATYRVEVRTGACAGTGSDQRGAAG